MKLFDVVIAVAVAIFLAGAAAYADAPSADNTVQSQDN